MVIHGDLIYAIYYIFDIDDDDSWMLTCRWFCEQSLIPNFEICAGEVDAQNRQWRLGGFHCGRFPCHSYGRGEAQHIIKLSQVLSTPVCSWSPCHRL